MPYKDPEKARECARRYYLRNKEKARESQRRYELSEKGQKTKQSYYETNKQILVEKAKKWEKDNPEKAREKAKKYRSTDKGIKSNIINKWKSRGLVDDYDKVYERYEYTLFCDLCSCDLDQCTKSVKSMDHDHNTGLFRNILCRMCNWRRMN